MSNSWTKTWQKFGEKFVKWSPVKKLVEQLGVKKLANWKHVKKVAKKIFRQKDWSQNQMLKPKTTKIVIDKYLCHRTKNELRADWIRSCGLKTIESWPPGAEDVESRPKVGRRGQPLQDREPMPGAEDVESRPKIGRRGQPLQDREPMPGAEDVESRTKIGLVAGVILKKIRRHWPKTPASTRLQGRGNLKKNRSKGLVKIDLKCHRRPKPVGVGNLERTKPQLGAERGRLGQPGRRLGIKKGDGNLHTIVPWANIAPISKL